MSQQHVTTVVTTVIGQQPETVSSSTGSTPHVEVKTGTVWLTCLDIHAVAAHAYAWSTAEADAIGYLPHLAHINRSPRQPAATVVLRQVGFVQPQVFRSRDDDPYLEVIVGALRTRAYDQAAVVSIAQAWARALATARTVWSQSPTEIDAVRVQNFIRERGLPEITQPGLPPAL